MFYLGTCFKIPVYFHWSIIFLIIFLGMPSGLGAYFSIYLCFLIPFTVLIHEFGHALTAKYFNIKVNAIVLFALGGVAQMEEEGRTIYQKLAITAAGPGVNLIVGMISLVFHILLVLFNLASLGNIFIFSLWFANIILGLFNLFPAFPMDGGRLLRAGLSKVTGHVMATKIATDISLVASILAIAYGLSTFNLMFVFVALFVIYTANQERKSLGINTYFNWRKL